MTPQCPSETLRKIETAYVSFTATLRSKTCAKGTLEISTQKKKSHSNLMGMSILKEFRVWSASSTNYHNKNQRKIQTSQGIRSRIKRPEGIDSFA
jgi:hypothetical protein